MIASGARASRVERSSSHRCWASRRALHCLVLDGVYRRGADGVPVFIEAGAPSDYQIHAVLQTLITRLMRRLTGYGVLVQDLDARVRHQCSQVFDFAGRGDQIATTAVPVALFPWSVS